MKATVVTSITISATQKEVFKYLSVLKYYYLWNPQIRQISSKGELQKGSIYKVESQVMGITIKASNEVTAFDPPKMIVIENYMGIVKYKAIFRLSAKGSKTQVKLSTELSTNGAVFVFTAPVLKQLALRELRTDLQALKVAVENQLK